MTKRIDIAAAKQRRQKKIAIGGAVLLVAVLAIQVPRTLDMLGSGSEATPAPSAADVSPSAGSPDAAAATSVPAATSAGAQSSAVLVDSDPLPDRAPEHVVSFERFGSKDPFVAQVSDASALPQAPTAAPAPQVSPQPPAETPSADGTPATQAPAGGPQEVEAPRQSIVVEVNGERETVALSQSFPQSEPTFRLVSLSGNTAMIGLAGGTYANGVQTVALQLGKTLTLANTADGTRYELRLVAVG